MTRDIFYLYFLLLQECPENILEKDNNNFLIAHNECLNRDDYEIVIDVDLSEFIF